VGNDRDVACLPGRPGAALLVVGVDAFDILRKARIATLLEAVSPVAVGVAADDEGVNLEFVVAE